MNGNGLFKTEIVDVLLIVLKFDPLGNYLKLSNLGQGAVQKVLNAKNRKAFRVGLL